MQYHHTQHAPLHYLLWAIALGQAMMVWFVIDQPVVMVILFLGAAVIGLFAACFMHLTIRDEGDQLAVRFGPLPFFRKTIPYEQISEVAPGRSSLIDGWGIHYVFSRGWIYNLWGFDCVELKVRQKPVRLGSDDVPNLVEFLKTRIRTNRNSFPE